MQPLHSRRHPAWLPRDDGPPSFCLTFVTLAARGADPPLTSVADLIIAVFTRLAAKRGWALRAWCVMPGHLHVVIETDDRGATVEGWLRYAKRETERHAGRRLWQRSFWDRDLRGGEDADATVAYVLDDPVRRGLCHEWTQWPWSWSAWHSEAGHTLDAANEPDGNGGANHGSSSA